MDISRIDEARSLAMQRRMIVDRIRAIDHDCELVIHLGDSAKAPALKTRASPGFQERTSQITQRSGYAIKQLLRTECCLLLEVIDEKLKQLGVEAGRAA